MIGSSEGGFITVSSGHRIPGGGGGGGGSGGMLPQEIVFKF